MAEQFKKLGFVKLAGATLVSLCFAATASAQFAPDSNAPISGSADNAEYKPNLTVLSGQVDVRQGDVRILADTMRIHSSQGSAGQNGAFDDVSKIEAIGNFYYITPDQEVKGDRGVYQSATEDFTVTGNVILLQGEDNVVTGERLIYNLNTEEARVIGTCKGRKCGSNGRVNILIKNTDSARRT